MGEDPAHLLPALCRAERTPRFLGVSGEPRSPSQVNTTLLCTFAVCICFARVGFRIRFSLHSPFGSLEVYGCSQDSCRAAAVAQLARLFLRAAGCVWMGDAHRRTCPLSLCFSGAKGFLVWGT